MVTDSQRKEAVEAGAASAKALLASSNDPLMMMDELCNDELSTAHAMGWNSVWAAEENSRRWAEYRAKNTSILVLKPTESEVALMAYLRMSLGHSAQLEPAEQQVFLQTVRQASNMVEEGGEHEIIAKAFVARTLQESDSPVLKMIGENYFSVFPSINRPS